MAMQLKAKDFVLQQCRSVILVKEKTFHKVKSSSKRMMLAYSKNMKKRPYLMNSVNACWLGLVGDGICQKLVEKKQEMDWKRTARFVFFCTYYQVKHHEL